MPDSDRRCVRIACDTVLRLSDCAASTASGAAPIVSRAYVGDSWQLGLNIGNRQLRIGSKHNPDTAELRLWLPSRRHLRQQNQARARRRLRVRLSPSTITLASLAQTETRDVQEKQLIDITTPASASIGIDIGKDIFHLIAFEAAGKIAFRRKIRRLALADTFKVLLPCIVGVESCLSAHFVSRVLSNLGNEPRIIQRPT